MDNTPTYPQTTSTADDAALQQLQAQTDQQRQDAIKGDVEQMNAQHALMYGTRMNLGTGGSWLAPLANTVR